MNKLKSKEMEDRQIKAKDIKKLLLRVYKRYTAGAITDVQAQRNIYTK